MKFAFFTTFLLLEVAMSDTQGFYDFTYTNIKGETVKMDTLKGKKVLIVNTASKCGFTKQYKGLEELYQKHKDQNFTIIGFPSNDFGGQEPGSNQEIAEFCRLEYGVSFPMAEKVVVKGKDKVPLFQFLTTQAPRKGEIKWNFEKFLIDEEGKVIERFSSMTSPASIGKSLAPNKK
jgi:glutathione peroxidase